MIDFRFLGFESAPLPIRSVIFSTLIRKRMISSCGMCIINHSNLILMGFMDFVGPGDRVYINYKMHTSNAHTFINWIEIYRNRRIDSPRFSVLMPNPGDWPRSRWSAHRLYILQFIHAESMVCAMHPSEPCSLSSVWTKSKEKKRKKNETVCNINVYIFTHSACSSARCALDCSSCSSCCCCYCLLVVISLYIFYRGRTMQRWRGFAVFWALHSLQRGIPLQLFHCFPFPNRLLFYCNVLAI